MADSFPALLTRYRQQAGLSVADVARATGCDPSHVSRLERGERAPGRRIVQRLCLALRLSQTESESLLLAAGYAPPGFAARLAWAERQLARWEAWYAESQATAPLLLGPLPGVAPREPRQVG
jgi:transcriptional regulator with XRE-family HTH domain